MENATPTAEEQDILIMYKASFLKKGTWDAILQLIIHLLSVPYSERAEKEHARLRLILCLVRNVLSINDAIDSMSSSNSKFWNSTLQEDLIVLMKQEFILDFIISMAATANEPEFRPWSALLLEIVYYIFRDRSVDDILTKPRDSSALQNLLAKENASKKTNFKSTRHARFGGTFSLKTSVFTF